MNVFRAVRTFVSKIRVRPHRNCIAACSKLHPKMEGTRSIQKLGYTFNDDGQIRKLDDNGQPSDEPFQFNISGDHQECQAHYEELGTAITYYVYNILETELGLNKIPIPKDSDEGSFFFASENYENKEILLILIHGNGVVRAGQWARSLIINESLEKGSQIPYIKRALDKDYGVVVLNTNDNITADGKPMPNSSSPEEHASYVWKNYLITTKAFSILIVAHSYGGVVAVNLSEEFADDFQMRVKAIALTDSVHSFSNKKVTNFLKQVGKNWISSQSPLDAPLKTPDFDIIRVSAGHEKHEMTSHTSIDSIFTFFEEMLAMNEK